MIELGYCGICGGVKVIGPAISDSALTQPKICEICFFSRLCVNDQVVLRWVQRDMVEFGKYYLVTYEQKHYLIYVIGRKRFFPLLVICRASRLRIDGFFIYVERIDKRVVLNLHNGDLSKER